MRSTGTGAAGPQRTERRRTASHRGRLLVVTVSLFGSLLAAVGGTAQADPGDIGFEGPSYTGAASGVTGEKPESKLWWNDGKWWAVLYDTATTDYYIWRLNLSTNTWEKTATQLDDRPNTKSDVLWDEASGKLYVSSHVWSESPATGFPARLYRYSYNAGSDTYSLDTGFPATIHNDKAETTVIDKDSTGQIWATWVRGGKVWVNRTVCNPTCDDAAWGTPFVHPDTVSNTVSSDDISSLVTFANNRVGLMWSDQSDDSMFFSIHSDSAGDATWQTKQVAYGGPGSNNGDDHINLKSLHADTGDRVYAAVKTSRSGSDPLVVLLRYDLSQNQWASGVFGTGTQDHTRPIVVLDTTNNLVHMFATADAGNGGGAIYRKTTSLSANGPLTLSPSGLGEKVLWDASSDKMNNVTSTKQVVNSTTGMVIVASEAGSQRYWWNYFPLTGGGANTPPVAVNDSYSTPVDTALNAPAPGVLANDSDANGDTLTASKTAEPAHGSVTLDPDGSFTYTPATGFTGTDTFKYKAADASSQSNEATVTITVSAGGGGSTTTINPTEDAYVRSNAPTENTGSATTLRVYKSGTTETHSYLKFVVPALSGTITDVKLRLFVDRASSIGGSLYAVPSNGWSEGTIIWNTKPPMSGSALGILGPVTAGQWVELGLTGAIGGSGTYSFGLKDGGGSAAWYRSSEGTNPPQLVITTSGAPPGNAAPVAVNDGYSTTEDTALVVPADGVLTNDTDADGDPLSAAKTADPANGSVTLNADGSFTYTPNTGFTGTDTFKYRASDGTDQSNEATVTITVSPAGGGGSTVTLNPVEDAYVRSNFPTENTGSATTIRVYKSGTTETHAYLRFVVPVLAGPITDVKLRLFVNRASSVGGTVYPVSDLTWQEESITWNTKPPAGATALATIGPASTLGTWVEVNLTGAVSGDTTYSFAIANGSTNAVWYVSKEGTQKPELVITTS